MRAVRCLRLRFDRSPYREVLSACITALAKSRDDNVHNLLLPLLKHEDSAVPIFAMKAIAGRTGNSYVAPIHMGALASGRRDLVKQSFRCMPCPIWDERNRPIVREALVKIFDHENHAWDFRDDPEWMRLTAFVAARDFGITKARDCLLDMIGGADQEAALRAIGSLGDTYYRKTGGIAAGRLRVTKRPSKKHPFGKAGCIGRPAARQNRLGRCAHGSGRPRCTGKSTIGQVIRLSRATDEHPESNHYPLYSFQEASFQFQTVTPQGKCLP